MGSEKLILKDGERCDDTGFGGFRVIQADDFSYGLDAVLLAAFAAGETGASGVVKVHPVMADLGSGNGIVPFILAHKIPDSSILGIEFSEEYIDRAMRGTAMNGLEDRVTFLEADVNDIKDPYPAESFGDGMNMTLAGRFDSVVTNPPYFRKGSAIPNPKKGRMAARHETTADLDGFLRCAAMMLTAKGDFYMVHRPSRLTDILTGMRAVSIEPKELQMVVPRSGSAPNILLLHGVRNGGRDLRVLPEMVVHGDGQDYTDEIERIYERDQLFLNRGL